MIAEPVKQIERVELTRHRFTVAEFLRMAEVGLLTEDDRVELIQGEVVEMSPINVAHASTVSRILSVLSQMFGNDAILSVQNPLQLDNETLPQPDVTLLRPRDDFYSKEHPKPEDVLFLIEVSDTTVSYDYRVKSVLYGAAGVPEYWLVNLPARQIEVFRDPQNSGYRLTIRYAPGETLSPLAFPDAVVNVDDFLGTNT